MDYKTKIGLFSFLGCLITIGSVFAAFTIDATSEVDIDDIDPEVDFDKEIRYDMSLSDDVYVYNSTVYPITMSCYEHHQFYTPLDSEYYHLNTFTMTYGSGKTPVELNDSVIKVFLEGSSGKKDLIINTDYTISNDEVTIIEDSVYGEDIKNYKDLVVEYCNTDPNVFTPFDYVQFTRTTV